MGETAFAVRALFKLRLLSKVMLKFDSGHYLWRRWRVPLWEDCNAVFISPINISFLQVQRQLRQPPARPAAVEYYDLPRGVLVM